MDLIADLLHTALALLPSRARHSPSPPPRLKMSTRHLDFPFDEDLGYKLMKPEQACSNCKAQDRKCYYHPEDSKDLSCVTCHVKRQKGCDQKRRRPKHKAGARESSIGLSEGGGVVVEEVADTAPRSGFRRQGRRQELVALHQAGAWFGQEGRARRCVWIRCVLAPCVEVFGARLLANSSSFSL